MLLEEFDANKTAIINPDMCVEKIENFPEVTISCFSENYNKHLVRCSVFSITNGHCICAHTAE